MYWFIGFIIGTLATATYWGGRFFVDYKFLKGEVKLLRELSKMDRDSFNERLKIYADYYDSIAKQNITNHSEINYRADGLLAEIYDYLGVTRERFPESYKLIKKPVGGHG